MSVFPVSSRDDCLAAAIATVLGLTLDDLPAIPVDAEGRWERWRSWLNRRGWDAIIVDAPPLPGWGPRGVWIAAHATDDPEVLHAVVWDGDEQVWDPSNTIMHGRLREVRSGIVLVPLQPLAVDSPNGIARVETPWARPRMNEVSRDAAAASWR